MKSTIKHYISAVDDLETIGGLLCDRMQWRLKKVLPSIRVEFECQGGSVGKICIFDRTHNHVRVEGLNIINIIRLCFPELDNYIEAPYALYVTRKEREQIIKVLKQETFYD